ncbi:hypothetical protein L9F63_000079 [Diploptera punctata]|uniref:Rab-GAP TBC domain-containing protein n=1 Tax=Diploptera punctata TaxID=6984 RepID=A0AAD8AP28_DIPPU|nr:hypothetical protein L9F63_000079 [Diploptera punctata]
MIYLIEGVLPESYFANNLRGLSVDMAVFRDLLRLRLPTLSRHLEQLQHEARDSATGTSYEPPLTNVFTMQWFLTLFSNCLPQSTVLRVWDLIFLEGNEVLLRTALAIWDDIPFRIMAVDSADEFYSIMGVLTREMLEFGLMDTNNLIKTIVTIAPFPFPELPDLRDKYLYNITPWTHTVSTAARRGLKLFHSDDDDEGTDEDDEKIAVAATYGISAVFRSARRRVRNSMNRAPSPSSSLSALNFTAPTSDRDRLVPVLDISALKQQYVKLRERQRQAHIILTAACARQPLGPSAPNPVAMNHLLLGKTALLSVRGSGPPPGQLTSRSTLQPVPPQKQKEDEEEKSSGETLHWKDAARRKQRRGSKQDIAPVLPSRILSLEESEAASSVVIPVIKEPEVEEIRNEVGSDSDDSKSSTSTELCDEPDRLSDFDSEEPTSISDASSYVPPAAEQVVMKVPSPIKSGFRTPEIISPMKDEVLPVQKHQISISPTSDIKHSVKLSPEQLEESVPDATDVSPSFVATTVSPVVMEEVSSPVQQILSPIMQSLTSEQKVLSPVKEISTKIKTPDVSHSDITTEFLPEIAEMSIKSPEPEVKTESIDREEIISDSFVLKLPSPLKESASLKEKQISPQFIKDTSLKENLILENINLKESAEFKKEIISPLTGKDISVSPISPEVISLKTPEISDSDIEESSSLLVRELSSLRSHSPVSGEIKTISEQDFTIDETFTEEYKDSSLIKMGSLSSDDLEKLDSDPGYVKQFPLLSPMSDISPLTEETVETTLIDWSDRCSIKISAPSIKKSSSTHDVSEDKIKNLQNAKSFQNLRDISSTRHLDRFSSTYSDRLSNEILRTLDKTEVEDIQEIEQVVEMIVPNIEVTSVKVEEQSCVDDTEKVSKLLELNQKLHERVHSIEEDKGDDINKLENEIDYAEMTDLLELDTNINFGRRNSERALQIIQENSEILQRIMLCQARRPSKLSEEESNGGTTTIPSEAESIPTSSSAENVDITTCQIKDDSVDKSDIFDLKSVSPIVDSVPITVLEEVPIMSSTVPSSHLVKSEEICELSSEKQLSLSEDLSLKSWKSVSQDSPKKEEISEKDENTIKSESPYSFSYTSEDTLTFLKCEKQIPVITSTRSFTLSPEIPSKHDHRFSLDYGDTKYSVDSRETKIPRLSPDDKCTSIFEDKSKYTNQFEDDYKETKTQKFELESDKILIRKRYDGLESSLGESSSSQFPRRYSPETTLHSSYSSVISKSTKNGLDFFDTPSITDSDTRTLSSSRRKWTDDIEFKTEKTLSTSRESPPLFESTVSKYPYESTSSSSWLAEKPRRERESSPVKSFESRSTSHYSSLSSDVSVSKPYASIGRYDYSFTTPETDTYFSSEINKTRDTRSPISTKDSSSPPLDSFSFKTSSDRSDKSSTDDYQQKLSYSPSRKYTDESVYSFHPSVSSVEFSSGTQDITRRTTTRDLSRPHSTIISDLGSMEVLNRSYSSSSIDGYLSRSRLDLASSDSPEPGKTSLSSSFKPISDETSVSSEKSRSILRSPIYEFDSPKRTSPSSHYRHLSPRRDEFDSKTPSKDTSPPRYSSFSDSNWDKNEFSSRKSQYRKSSIDTENLTSETSSTSLSSKLGKSYSPPISPSKSKDINVSLPPIKSSLGSPVKSKSKFDPFPPRPTTRQPKELGIKLGLYSSETSSKNGRNSGKKT